MNYGMVRCDYLGVESLDEDDEAGLDKAIAHYGSREQFEAKNHHSFLYDEGKVCGVSEEWAHD